jgi:hypothetical protein
LKALAVVTDDKVFDHIEEYVGDDKNLKMYSHPEANDQWINNNSLRLAQFMFIYKEEGDSYLLGKDISFDYTSREEVIRGWVKKSVVQLWSDRVCYEPAWDIEGATERKDNNVKASLFSSPEEAIKYYDDENKSVEADWNFDKYENRMPPDIKRYPVLDVDKNNGVFTTGYVSPVFDSIGGTLLQVDDQSIVDKTSYEKIRDQAKYVNIMFVLDGDEGLISYNNKAIEAIQKSIYTIEEIRASSDNPVTFSFGAVIYYARCPGVENLVLSIPLNTNGDIVISRLKENLKKPSLCSEGEYRAVYAGLSKALQQFGGAQSSQSNYIVLVGAACDQDDDVKQREIVVQMSENIQGILVFQASKGQAIQYDNFISQISDITLQTAMRVYTELKNNKDIQKKVQAGEISLKKPQWDNDYQAITMKTLSVGTSSAINANLVFVPTGGSLDLPLFSKMMDTLTTSLYAKTRAYIEEIDDQVSGFERGTDKKLSQQFLKAWIKAGRTQAEFAKLSSKLLGQNYQFFIKGYFKTDFKELDNPIFEPVLLVSQNELGEFVAILGKFKSTDDPDVTRDNYVNGFKEIIRRYKGELSPEDMANMKAQDALALISSLKDKTKITGVLSNYTLEEIELERKFSSAKMKELEKIMTDKRKALNDYYNTQSNMFSLIDGIYFWVPQSLMP